jgi:hypothetical protein
MRMHLRTSFGALSLSLPYSRTTTFSYLDGYCTSTKFLSLNLTLPLPPGAVPSYIISEKEIMFVIYFPIFYAPF